MIKGGIENNQNGSAKNQKIELNNKFFYKSGV